MEDLPIQKQIQLQMDEIFQIHLGLRGNEYGGGDDSDQSSGESEDDY